MTINLTVPTTNSSAELKPRISVIGVGGAGGNAVNNMIQMGLEGVEFIVANSDAQALAHSASERKIQMGTEVTKGLGAGSNPSIGRAAAEESLDEILTHLNDVNMIFVTAGLGGGTGTGAAPIIAKVARDQGILTVGVVTKPFQFEGANRMNIAESGLEELQQYVDTLLIIPNQNLFRVANENTTFADAFKMADDVLYSGVRGVTDLMVMPGLINLDFADIKAVMSEMGKAMMGTGEAEGERRAIEAAEAAIANPLLDDTSMSGAKGVLINITAGKDITLFEVDEAANRIRDEVAEDANIIFGSTFEESLEGSVRVSVVATGIESAIGSRANSTIYHVTDFTEKPEAIPALTNTLNTLGETATVLPAEQQSIEEGSDLSETQKEEAPVKPEQQDLIEHAAGASQRLTEPVAEDDSSSNPSADGVFIPAPPADESAGPDTMADPFAVADMVNARAGRQGQKTSRRRGLSLIERVTGVALGERKPERKSRLIPSHPFTAKPPVISQNQEIQELTPKPENVPGNELKMSELVSEASTGNMPEKTTELLSEGDLETTPESAGKAPPESAQELTEQEGYETPTLLGEGAAGHHLNREVEEDLLDIPAFLRRQAN